jgi:hypothetical protein
VRWSPSERQDGLAMSAAILAVPVACFMLAASAVLASGGGFVSYRTIPIPTAIAAIALVFAVWSAVSNAVALATSRTAAIVAANGALLVVAGAAVAGNFELNYLTMRLARNEMAYFRGIVRQAEQNHSNAIILVDPRPFSLPEDHPVVTDQRGRAVPPYELSCFSGVCLQNGAIVVILAKEMGLGPDKLKVFSARGNEPVPGITCENIAALPNTYPPGASDATVMTLRYYRSLAPVTCVDYSLAWHDLAVDVSR